MGQSLCRDVLENRWIQATQATRDLPHGLDHGSCRTQCTSELIACSTIHRPTDQGFARSAASQAAATSRADRPPGDGSGGFPAMHQTTGRTLRRRRDHSLCEQAGNKGLRVTRWYRSGDASIDGGAIILHGLMFFIRPGHTEPNRIPPVSLAQRMWHVSTRNGGTEPRCPKQRSASRFA